MLPTQLTMGNDRDLHAFCHSPQARTTLKWTIADWQSMLNSKFKDASFIEAEFDALLDLSDDRGQVPSRQISAVARDLIRPACACTSLPAAVSGTCSTLRRNGTYRWTYEAERTGHRERPRPAVCLFWTSLLISDQPAAHNRMNGYLPEDGVHRPESVGPHL